MVRLMRRCAAVLALVILSSGPGNGLALAQDERPDLKIEVVGLKPNSQREVLVRVTNVGRWWAEKTTATVEAVPAAAGAKATEQVPDLGPKGDPDTASQFEFPYTLAAPCSGQKVEVKAVLKAAKTFNGNTESNTTNNSHTREVCAAQAAPKPPAMGDPVDPDAAALKPGPDPAVKAIESIGAPIDSTTATLKPGPNPGAVGIEAAIPEHTRPGSHTKLFFPSATLSTYRATVTGGPLILWPDGLAVGWSKWEGVWESVNGAYTMVFQTAVDFDLTLLDEVPLKSISKAVLTFHEDRFVWRDGEGREQVVAGCVEGLGRATVDWTAQPTTGLFPNEKVEGHSPGVQEWTVTMEVDRWVKNEKPRFGFVLRGGNENPFFTRGDDLASCMSTISALELAITWVVPD